MNLLVPKDKKDQIKEGMAIAKELEIAPKEIGQLRKQGVTNV